MAEAFHRTVSPVPPIDVAQPELLAEDPWQEPFRARVLGTEDAAEGIRSFVERRPAQLQVKQGGLIAMTNTPKSSGPSQKAMEVLDYPDATALVAPVTGVFEAHDGSITYWRDYFDAATILSQQPAG